LTFLAFISKDIVV